jgi:hypothetical protein
MKFGRCPLCESRTLKKIQGEEFECEACKAPLRFTWSLGNSIAIILPIGLSNLMSHFSDPIRYGVPAVVLLLLLFFYFKYRNYHLDDIRINESLNALQDDVRHADNFLAGKIGVIDMIERMSLLKDSYGKNAKVQAIAREHFNRIGGLNLAEQSEAFSSVYPDIDLQEFALRQKKAAQQEISRLQSYKLNA